MNYEAFNAAQWLFPAALLLHNLEEASTLPAWSRERGKFRRPVGDREFGFAATAISLLSFLITLGSLLGGPHSLASLLFFAFNFALLLDALVWHIGAGMVTRSVIPGTFTSLAIMAPSTALLLYNGWRLDYFSPLPFGVTALLFTLGLWISLPLFYRLGRWMDGATARVAEPDRAAGVPRWAVLKSSKTIRRSTASSSSN